MALADLTGKALIRHDVIEVLHQIGPSHDRHSPEVGFGHARDINPPQSVSMPARAAHRSHHHPTYRMPPPPPQPSRRPLDTRHILGKHRLKRGDETSTQNVRRAHLK